ncbi:PIG-L family deacetylase [Candidatus Dependentiae bacterium]|nr:PIG-L family deacetylase [Candidatus Dependentiae bacterium]
MTETEVKKILIVAAHPDDEVLGCGGLIAKYSKNKQFEFYTLILTAGANTRYHENMEKVLKQNAAEANEILGVKKLFIEDLPNQELDSIPLTTVIKTIEKYTDLIKPEILFINNGSDLNKDHQVAYEAGITVSRPVTGQFIKRVYSYFTASSTEWGLKSRFESFFPNLYIDITESMEYKIKSMECYKTENRNYPHPRSSEALCKYAEYFAISSSCGKYAEPFMLLRNIEGELI